jgi:hypothetical protein
MDDWSYRKIQDVQAGEWVVGVQPSFSKGVYPQLIRTQVVETRKRRAPAREYTSKHGVKIRCTSDHLWWTKRSGRDGHSAYLALGDLGKYDLKSLTRVSNFHGWDREPEGRGCMHQLDSRWQYLAGIIDGEGTCASRIVIAQSGEHNPEVHARIIETMSSLRIPFSRHERAARSGHKQSTLFAISGGRHMRHKILRFSNPAKSKGIISSLYGSLGGKTGTTKETFVSYRELGERDVYTLQTGTGNYIANGFVSKNCQLLADPQAGNQRMFNAADLVEYEVRPETLMVYLLIDPARSMKKDSAHTAMVVLGLDVAGNKFLLDGFDHKMDLMNRWSNMRDLWETWSRMPGVQGVKVGYEKFGALADLDYFQERMRVEGAQFDIEELAWPRDGEGAKNDRVQRLTPDLRNHRLYVPYDTDPDNMTKAQRRMEQSGYDYRISRPIRRLDENRQMYDLTERLRMQIGFFPFCERKDVVDALSRVYDLEPVRPERPVDSLDLEPEVL